MDGKVTGRSARIARICVFLVILASSIRDLAAISVTVTDVECVYEYVFYDGDTVSGNFVVVDHDIFWSSTHPGIDFTGLDWHDDIPGSVFRIVCMDIL